MKLHIAGRDVTELVPSISTSGSKKECARTLKCSVVQSPTDSNISSVPITLGAPLVFYGDGQEFTGTITAITRSTDSSKIDVTAKDGGIYISKNQCTFKVKSMTAEGAAAYIAAVNGVPTSYLAPTGFVFSRNYVAQSVYDAIMTGYTLAAAATGGKYYVRFEGSYLCVRERGSFIAAVISEGANLITAAYSESIESLVTAVDVYDAAGNLKTTVGGSSQYGTFRRQITEGGNESGIAKAEEMIRSNGVDRKGTVQNLGNPACITGNAVIVKEHFTGLYGLFYIDADTHTWKNGIYTNKLTLAWENTMDEKSAGTALDESKAKKAAAAGQEEKTEVNGVTMVAPDGSIIYQG